VLPALDVIHVQVGQQDVDPGEVRRQLRPEPANARAGVEQQHRAVVTAHLDAGGVAAVARGLPARCRDGAAGAKQGHTHHPRSPKQSRGAQEVALEPKRSGMDCHLDVPACAVQSRDCICSRALHIVPLPGRPFELKHHKRRFCSRCHPVCAAERQTSFLLYRNRDEAIARIKQILSE
jgi:hypothetical protein